MPRFSLQAMPLGFLLSQPASPSLLLAASPQEQPPVSSASAPLRGSCSPPPTPAPTPSPGGRGGSQHPLILCNLPGHAGTTGGCPGSRWWHGGWGWGAGGCSPWGDLGKPKIPGLAPRGRGHGKGGHRDTGMCPSCDSTPRCWGCPRSAQRDHPWGHPTESWMQRGGLGDPPQPSATRCRGPVQVPRPQHGSVGTAPGWVTLGHAPTRETMPVTVGTVGQGDQHSSAPVPVTVPCVWGGVFGSLEPSQPRNADGKATVSAVAASVGPAGSVPWWGSRHSWCVPKGDTGAARPPSQFAQPGADWFPARGAGGKRQVSAGVQGRLGKPGIKLSLPKFPLSGAKRDAG